MLQNGFVYIKCLYPGVENEMDSLNPLRALRRAQQAVPAVRYAMGLAGVAAATSIITSFVGDAQASVRTLGLVFAGMILLYVFAVMVRSSKAAHKPAKVLVWVLVAAYVIFVSMTVTVFVFEWPCLWMRFLGIASRSTCLAPSTGDPFGFAP